MTVKLLVEQHLEFLSLKGGCTGLSEAMLVKMPHCWKLHVAAHMYLSHMRKTSFIVSSEVRNIIFGVSLHLLSYFDYASSKGTWESGTS